jgi:hypothetical protein
VYLDEGLEGSPARSVNNHAFMFHVTASLDWANSDNERFQKHRRLVLDLLALTAVNFVPVDFGELSQS